jgi:hypothetical protein
MAGKVQEWNESRWWHVVAENMIAEAGASARSGAVSETSQASGPIASPHLGGSSGTGDCYGGPVPDYIVTRESRGDPNVVNPSSGARGCFQIIPSTHAAACSDLGWSVEEQKACASRLPSSAWGY